MRQVFNEFFLGAALLVGLLFAAGFPEPRLSEIARVCQSTGLPAGELDRFVVAAYGSGDFPCAERLGRAALWRAKDDLSRRDALANLAAVLQAEDKQKEAVGLYEDALDVNDRLSASDRLPETSLLLHLATAQDNAGLKEEAQDTYARLRAADVKRKELALGAAMGAGSSAAAQKAPPEAAPEAPPPPAPEAAEEERAPASRGVEDMIVTAMRRAPKPPTPVTVYYGTDRNAVSVAGKPLQYGQDSADALQLGRVLVTLPPGHRYGDVYDPALLEKLRRLLIGKNPQQDPVVAETEALDVKTFLAEVKARFAAGENDAFVFIHGFNTSFDDAALRTAQMAFDMGFPGVPMFYSWPSEGSPDPMAYARDYDMSSGAGRTLGQFLELIEKQTGASHVWLIAHSMGARALTAALTDLVRQTDTAKLPKFDAILLAAPDIPVKDFTQVADVVMGRTQAATLYVSATDRALWLSKILRHDILRLGDVAAGPVVIKGIDTVDASLVDTSFFGHNYFAESRSVLGDISEIMNTALPAAERPGLRPKSTLNGQRYWTISACGDLRLVC